MKFGSIILAFLIALSSPVRAQSGLPISSLEWQQALDDVSVQESDLRLAATDLAKEATRMLNSGERTAGIKMTVMGLVLSRYVSQRYRRPSDVDWRTNVQYSDELLDALLAAGVSRREIDESFSSLESIIGDIPPAVVVKPRLATDKEKRLFIQLVTKHLIDPTSPIFGEAHVISNQACMTVNAKNRLGGYTGNQEAVFVKNEKTGEWTGGAMISYPHGVCVDSAIREQ